jgi:hypothetical protein
MNVLTYTSVSKFEKFRLYYWCETTLIVNNIDNVTIRDDGK